MGLEKLAEVNFVELWRFGSKEFGFHFVFSGKPQMGCKKRCDKICLKKIPLKYGKDRVSQQSRRENGGGLDLGSGSADGEKRVA